MQNLINTTPITQLIQQVKAAELGQHKEVKLSISQARLLVLALAEVLDKCNRDLETIYNAVITNNSKEEVITVAMDGGSLTDK